MTRRIKYMIPGAILFLVFYFVGEARAVDYTVSIALPDLCGDTYFGEEGCLYPGGNEPPAAYAAELAALDAALAAESQIVVVYLGMSAQQNINTSLVGMAPAGNVIEVNGAIGSKQQQWQDVNHWVWDTGLNNLPAGITPDMVDVVYYHNTIGGLSGSFESAVSQLVASFNITDANILTHYPNTKLILHSSRYFAPASANGGKSPEPYAYYSGFATKQLIEDRINCTVDCGPLKAWGAYTWDDTTPGGWYVSDGIHLSSSGKVGFANIVSGQLCDNWVWYCGGTPPPTATPGPSNTPTVVPTATPTVPGVTATPTPFQTSTPTSDATMTPTVRGGGCGRACQTATAEAGG